MNKDEAEKLVADVNDLLESRGADANICAFSPEGGSRDYMTSIRGDRDTVGPVMLSMISYALKCGLINVQHLDAMKEAHIERTKAKTNTIN